MEIGAWPSPFMESWSTLPRRPAPPGRKAGQPGGLDIGRATGGAAASSKLFSIDAAVGFSAAREIDPAGLLDGDVPTLSASSPFTSLSPPLPDVEARRPRLGTFHFVPRARGAPCVFLLSLNSLY